VFIAGPAGKITGITKHYTPFPWIYRIDLWIELIGIGAHTGTGLFLNGATLALSWE
jgi:hypothetical protein